MSAGSNATAWYAVTLSRLLADAGHEVVVLALADTEPEKAARSMGLNTVPVDLNTTNPIHFASAAKHIIQLLRTHRPDIVNCHRGEGLLSLGPA